ncbi:type IV toxin-antitoxin system AbiEi family antitoxin domain-containing protein [Streptomyces sp. P38-E01]|uniref:Type IV toxin-antitoxin system AbiEi family antitoxin domain-containing protein n=1 Tax=Streptomyces tardus TaxID=2780544 RepID=A0A949JNF8_9ACTN|nr:type IV toxin-antitoxin system AbiEi family antitoxin domain-containing protein [Streptomyces tardus]MBU7598336.1 type IV toxin-antitoxin system AbiEi family antitoxin domain-containing protein [Streptomyces tardus]
MPPRAPGARAVLWDVACRQRGCFTAARALVAGYSYQSQSYHARQGDWLSVERGTYRFREFEAMPQGEHDHLVRWHLWSKGRAVVSHTTALSVHDLGVGNPAKVHLTVPPGFCRRHASVVLHRAVLEKADIGEREGYRLTVPVRAIVESAEDLLDQEAVDSAVTEAMERGLTTGRRLVHAAQGLGSRAELAVERAVRAAR